MVRKKEASGKVFHREVSDARSCQTAPLSSEPKHKEPTMLKTFTVAAIALATGVASAPLHAHEFGIQLNGPELRGIFLNGPELRGTFLNGPSLNGSPGAVALDASGTRVLALRLPSGAAP